MKSVRKYCAQCGASFPETALFCPDDGAPLTLGEREAGPDPRIGRQIAEGLVLEQLVGLGATGRVYRARQAAHPEPVAVKILKRALCKNPEALARLRREETVIRRLDHPHIVRVLSRGEFIETDPGESDQTGPTVYLVMEYLAGVSLRSVLAARGTLPLESAVRIVLQAADAVGEAHALGIVHRDLKPENIMLVSTGPAPDWVKVLDFGAARVTEQEGSLLTKTGAIFGTARYISPEAARGEAVGPPADVYALTTMLFELLVGEPPFDGPSPVAILVQHATAPIPDIRARCPTPLPDTLCALVTRNLSKAPGERLPDARSLGRELAGL